ncbi:lipopolysaccharide biosynthesis protein [Psychrobacter immobilis]|uniref:lipopolysaccharide biosynthesis protein n=1 Tax=Psychrobacter immobilis TaxID=498 RepID=UPI00191ADF06|nr:hypothetical protein [Psychrobacter immobilis]
MSKLLKYITFKIVYIDYALKLVGQFIIFSFLIKTVSSEDFGDYAYNLLVFGYTSSIINSSFDALINKDLADNNLNSKEDYFHYFKFKIILYLLVSILLINMLSISFTESFCFLILGLVGVANEHLDLKMRFLNDYKPIFFRLLFYPFFFIVKLILAIKGLIIETVVISIIECLVAIIINLRLMSLILYFGGERSFAQRNYRRVLQTGTSGFLIFTFLSLDQFFTYRYLGKDIYAGYAVLYRFYSIVNAMINIYSRYLIPKLYLNQVSYPYVLKRLMLANVLLLIPVYVCFYLYINYWTVQYSQTLIAFPILVLASFGLIFGQVRGVYFVKSNKLNIDIYNAGIGIAVFIIAFIVVAPQTSVGIAMCYALGVLTSGILTTFFYKEGIEYLRKLN